MRSLGSYLDYSGRDDALSGGARMIPVTTPMGGYRVWVKRIGNNPDLRVLLLHGGPGSTHEYLEACDSYLPAAEVEYYHHEPAGQRLYDLGRSVPGPRRGSRPEDAARHERPVSA
jgi:proline iminopeptidase